MQSLRNLFSSKKFITSLGAIVAILMMKLSAKAGFVLDHTTADEIATLVCVVASTYVLAQGIADNGKEAAKIKAEAEKQQ